MYAIRSYYEPGQFLSGFLVVLHVYALLMLVAGWIAGAMPSDSEHQTIRSHATFNLLILEVKIAHAAVVCTTSYNRAAARPTARQGLPPCPRVWRGLCAGMRSGSGRSCIEFNRTVL